MASENRDDKSIIDLHLRPHDSNRNYTMMLSTIAKFSTIYRLNTGYVTATHTAFIKAQHISYRSSKQINSLVNGSLFAQRMPNGRFLSYNYFLDPGKTSFWQVSHICDKLKNNKIIGDNLCLLVSVNRKIKKPESVPNIVKEICDTSKTLYTQRHDRVFLDCKKELLSSHLNALSQMRKDGIMSVDNDNHIFRMDFQLRFSYEDPNKHLNSTMCVKVIEDTCFEWNKSVRDNKLFIDCITVLYWKEIPVEKNRFIYPCIWNKDNNGYYYGSIMAKNDENVYENRVGFVFKLTQTSPSVLKSNL